MLNYSLLSKAINNLDKKKQVKPKVDAAAFVSEISGKYNTIDKYFIEDPTPLMRSGDEMFDKADLASLECALTLKEMLEKL